MSFKCALVGCGGRAVGHANAYTHVARGSLAAVCDIMPDRLEAFGERFAIKARYSDLETMLVRERPDVLHVVTAPNHRLDVLSIADAAGVPAVIVEKPIAIQGEDYLELCEFNKRARTKTCLNHQLHFHPRRLQLERYVKEGHIGEARLIDASARLNLSGQGTHVLELVSAFNSGAKPVGVFANVAGTQEIEANNAHAAPDESVASIDFDNGVRAQFQCGRNAPVVGEGANHTHKRIAVYGTRGFVHWTMKSWEYSGTSGAEHGSHTYAEEDILGQAALTEAVFDWLEDEANVHPTNLSASLEQFNTILGIYTSALEHRCVALPVTPAPALIDALKRRLKAA